MTAIPAGIIATTEFNMETHLSGNIFHATRKCQRIPHVSYSSTGIDACKIDLQLAHRNIRHGITGLVSQYYI